MGNLLWYIIGGIVGIYLATTFVPGVSIKIIPGQSVYFGISLTQKWQIIVLVGVVLGLINFFIKPLLNKITWPLKALTLGLFSLILNMAIIWFLDVLFVELEIERLIALFWTTVIIWLINSLLRLKS